MEALKEEYLHLRQRFDVLRKLARINLDLLFLSIDETESPEAKVELDKVKELVQALRDGEENSKSVARTAEISNSNHENSKPLSSTTESLDHYLDTLVRTFEDQEMMDVFQQLLQRAIYRKLVCDSFSLKSRTSEIFKPVTLQRPSKRAKRKKTGKMKRNDGDLSEVQSLRQGVITVLDNVQQNKSRIKKLPVRMSRNSQRNSEHEKQDDNCINLTRKVVTKSDLSRIGDGKNCENVQDSLIGRHDDDHDDDEINRGIKEEISSNEDVIEVVEGDDFDAEEGKDGVQGRLIERRDEDDDDDGMDRSIKPEPVDEKVADGVHFDGTYLFMKYSKLGLGGLGEREACSSGKLGDETKELKHTSVSAVDSNCMVSQESAKRIRSQNPSWSSSSSSSSYSTKDKKSPKSSKSKALSEVVGKSTIITKKSSRSINTQNLLEEFGIPSAISDWNSKDPLGCPLCHKLYGTKASFIAHLRIHKREKEGTIQTPEPQLCTICGKTLKDKYNLKSHLQLHTTKDKGEYLKCPRCGKEFLGDKRLRWHVTRYCHDLKSHLCDICGKSYKTKRVLELHKRSVHSNSDTKPEICKVCGEGFSNWSNLHRHMKIHRGELPYSCSICGRKFRSNYNRNAHEKRHTGNFPYRCSLCDHVGFLAPGHLREHERKYHAPGMEGKPFESGRIMKRSNRRLFKCGSNSLQLSQENERLKRKYNCETCGKEFPNRSNLKRHTFLHTGAKPYKCSTCGRSFGTNTILKKHMWTHSAVKQFPCEKCDKGFGDKRNYLSHMKKFHPEYSIPIAATETKESSMPIMMTTMAHPDSNVDDIINISMQTVGQGHYMLGAPQ